MGVNIVPNGKTLQFDVKTPSQYIALYDGNSIISVDKLASIKVELIRENDTNQLMYDIAGKEAESLLPALTNSTSLLIPLALNGTLQLSGENYVRVTIVLGVTIDASTLKPSYELVKTYHTTRKPLIIDFKKYKDRVDVDTSFYSLILVNGASVKTLETTFVEKDVKGNEEVKNVFHVGDSLKKDKLEGGLTAIATVKDQKFTIVSTTAASTADNFVYLVTA